MSDAKISSVNLVNTFTVTLPSTQLTSRAMITNHMPMYTLIGKNSMSLLRQNYKIQDKYERSC